MLDQHPDFTEAMLDAYRRARIEARYNSPQLLRMLGERHGHETALHLIRSHRPSAGFLRLLETGRLDLSAEAMVLRREWSRLFSREDLIRARQRLVAVGYQFPADSWNAKQQEVPPTTPIASDLECAPPERVRAMVYRILRDTALAREMKTLHNYRCQICDHTILLPDGSCYAEAHHIQPLGDPHRGPDCLANIVCVCPNHHAELDYGVSRIDLSALRSVSGHTVDQKYVDYHNRVIAK